MKVIEIAFCKANLEKGAVITFNQLNQYHSLPIQLKAIDCLGYCGRCISQFFAKVDQEVIQMDTLEELSEKILDHLSKNYKK